MKTLSLNFFRNYKTLIILLLSVILGISTGLVLGEKAKIFMPLGDIFLNLIFTFIIPTIFFMVSSSVANIITLQSTKRTLIISILTFLGMSFVSATFMLIILKILHPNVLININLSESVNAVKVGLWSNLPSMFTVDNFYKILSKETVLPLIIFSFLFGLAVKLLGKKAESAKHALNIGTTIMFKMIDFLMYYAPIGIFAFFASFFGISGKGLVEPAIKMISTFYIASVFFAVIFYSIYAYFSAGKHGLKALKFLAIPATTAFATRSSLAALPMSFESAEKINMPKSIFSLTLPLGSVFHLDGSSASAVFKIVFLFSMFGLPLTGFDFYFGIIIFSIFVSLLSSGIPNGGLILETLMLAYFGFPIEALPILLIVNSVVDPITSLINTCGNIVASMVICKFKRGSGWIFRKDIEEDVALGIYK